MTIECPHCKSELTSDEITIGRRVQCLNCGEKFVVDKLEEDVASTTGHTNHLRLLLWIIGAIAVLCIGFFLKSWPNSHSATKLDSAEIPTNSFSYVKNKLAILTLPDTQGSGFILEMGEKKYLLTNEHVVHAGNGARPRALLLTGETIELGACEVAKDRDLIRFEVPSNTASLCMSKEIPEIGDGVTVYGNSDGGGVSTETSGQVLGVGGDRIEIDAMFINGNSGSPVINEHGYVDGVATYLIRSTADEDNWVKRNTRYNAGVRRFATRVVSVPWVSVEWEEYSRQIQFCNDFEYYLQRLAPYLKVNAESFSPNRKADYSEQEKFRYAAMSSVFHPALIDVHRSYVALEIAWREREKIEENRRRGTMSYLDAAAGAQAIVEVGLCARAFNKSKYDALQIAKNALLQAKITLPVLGASHDDINVVEQYCQTIEHKQEGVGFSWQQRSAFVSCIIKGSESESHLERIMSYAALSHLVDRGDTYAIDQFVQFCEKEDRDNGLDMSQFVSGPLQKCLEDAYANGKNKTGYILGCVAFGKSKFSEAVKYWTSAAEADVPHAQYLLGVCYQKGKGVVFDEGEAVKWYRKSAEHGFPHAQYNLGVCYAHGIGVGPNKAEAIKWFRKAAEQGDADAQDNVGMCYRLGVGVEKDMKMAGKWRDTAVEHGCEKYKRHYVDMGFSKDEFGKVEHYYNPNLSIKDVSRGQHRSDNVTDPLDDLLSDLEELEGV